MDRVCTEVKLSQFSELSENKVHACWILYQHGCSNFALIDALASKVTYFVNYSLSKGYVPDQWKTALVTPLQKKNGNDFDFKTDYRPVSNLPFISKIAGKAVVDQLLYYYRIVSQPIVVFFY